MHPRYSIIRQCIAIELHHYYVVKYKMYIVKQLIKKKKIYVRQQSICFCC